MTKDPKAKSILPSYRVLDLTEGGCMIGGRLLGDMGADVIKIEPPGGSRSRIAPYYQNIEDPEKSLFWFAYNANKRGITLDLSQPEGQEIFRKLARRADVIIESFQPGFLKSLKLGYPELYKLKSDIILASITPFGQDGPKSGYKGSDLTAWASGGYLHACGDPDRAPTWISFPQAGLFGGAEAAIGSVTALWHRRNTGIGQQVDVSLQECAVSPNLNVLQMWDVAGVEFRRVGGALYVPATGVRQPIYFACKDGSVMILVQGGAEPFVSSSSRLVEWMDEVEMAPDWLKKLDWISDYDATTMRQAIADRVGKVIEAFTLTKTKAELYEEGAIKRRILIAPVYTTGDICQDIQLQARDYWVKLAHPEINDILTYCGPFISLSETPLANSRRAPLVGEHNQEIYSGELGMPERELASLKLKKVI